MALTVRDDVPDGGCPSATLSASSSLVVESGDDSPGGFRRVRAEFENLLVTCEIYSHA